MDTSPISQKPHRYPPPGHHPPSNSTEEPSDSDPIARLDALLITYLDRLDTYQKLREDLSKNLSAGFLSLAHANRTSNLGSGRRYGEDGYDERMKAGRRVEMEIRPKAGGDLRKGSQQEDVVESDGQTTPKPDSHGETISYNIVEHKPPSDVDVNSDSNDHPTHTPLPQEPKPEKSPPNISNNSLPPTDSSNANSKPPDPTTTTTHQPKPKPKSKPRSNNPLNWYGILTPPSLRQAQISFTTAVSEQIPSLLNLTSEMRELESRVRELRREAGLVEESENEEAEGEGENTVQSEDEDEDEDEDENKSRNVSKVPKSTSPRKHLSSRAKAKEPPRSRVLKLE